MCEKFYKRIFFLKKLFLAVVFPAPLGLVPAQTKKKKNWDNFLPKGMPRGSLYSFDSWSKSIL
jgi:hypothetical protein